VLAGDDLNAITADLVKSRALSVSGRPWNRTSLRGVLTRPTVAGLLVHRGHIVGPAPWPAIIDEVT
jgi:hypothetical protein